MSTSASHASQWSGFSSAGEYFSSLKDTPKLLLKRSLYVRHPEEQLADKAAAGVQMSKVLNWFHVMMLGTGMIVGAGIFVSTGAAANGQAGPAVVVSFIIAGISAMLSALCYSEFAAEFPFAGGAYNYIALSLGELAAWLVVTTLIMQYNLANAAVARAFSNYFATLIGKDPHFFTFPYQQYDVDFLAGGLVVACCVLLIFTTAGGSWFNIVVTGSQLLVILVILIAGFTKANPANMKPFLPFGVQGIFNGAAFVFFSFIGFDCVSTLAEEVKNPAIDMPVGIVGCITFVTVVYSIMALCLVMMVPYDLIDPAASYATAFSQVGYPWGQYLVGIGAVLGIVTGVLVGIMGVSRIVCSLGRTHLFFPGFGHINAKTGTPVNATLFSMVVTLPLAILTALDDLIDMVSAGTLMVFAVVAFALIWKRIINREMPMKRQLLPLSLLALVLGSSIAFGCVYILYEGLAKSIAMAVTGGALLICCVAIHLKCHQHNRPDYRVPFFPYLPALSLILNSFLMAALPGQAYFQLALFFAVVIGFYALYSIHAGTVFERKHGRGVLASKEPEASAAVHGISRTDSAVRADGSVLFAYEHPDHTRPMQGRWSGGVTRLPDEQ